MVQEGRLVVAVTKMEEVSWAEAGRASACVPARFGNTSLLPLGGSVRRSHFYLDPSSDECRLRRVSHIGVL